MVVALHSVVRDALWAIGVVAGAALVLLVTFQEKLLYVPVVPGLKRSYPYTPDRLLLPYEDVWLTARDGVRLHAWLLKNPSVVDGPTMLFFQENAGNIAHRLESIRHLMHRLRCNVFLLSYRGYGASDGRPSERGIRLDAQAALDHLLERSDIDSCKIIVFGRSLGGAVAADLCYRNPQKVRALVLENTFTSVLDMAAIVMPFLSLLISGRSFRPFNPLVRSQWRTADIIAKIDVPMLFLVGSADELVPPAHMRQLYRIAQSNPSGSSLMVEFPGGGHMDTWVRGGERYWHVLHLFMNHHTSGESARVDAREEYEETMERAADAGKNIDRIGSWEDLPQLGGTLSYRGHGNPTS